MSTVERQQDGRAPLAFRQVALVVSVWAAATAVALAIAAETRIGPVLISLSRRHGVHVGDIIGVLACYSAALLATRAIVRARHR